MDIYTVSDVFPSVREKVEKECIALSPKEKLRSGAKHERWLFRAVNPDTTIVDLDVLLPAGKVTTSTTLYAVKEATGYKPYVCTEVPLCSSKEGSTIVASEEKPEKPMYGLSKIASIESSPVAVINSNPPSVKEVPNKDHTFSFPDYNPDVRKYLLKWFKEPDWFSTLEVLVQSNRPVLLVGPAGCGKSMAVKYLCEKTGQKFYRVNFDRLMSPESFIGAIRVRTTVLESGQIANETYFQAGPVVKAMEEGAVLLLDEVDRSSPEYISQLHSLIEDPTQPFRLNDDGGRLIQPADGFRVVASANTLNLEDQSLGYRSEVLDVAFLDRFAVIKCDYSPFEEDLIFRITSSKRLSKLMVQVFSNLRSAVLAGQSTAVYSTRRLIAWVESLCVLKSLKLATEVELLSRLSSADKALAEQFLVSSFGKDWRSL
jgi:MoxR-like ATPase